MNLWVSQGSVKAEPPQLTREVAVSDGGQWYENPQPMHAWVGGKAADEAPLQIPACDIPAAFRESLAAHQRVSAFCLFFFFKYHSGRKVPKGLSLGQGWILARHSSLCGFAFCPVRVAVGCGWVFPPVQAKPRREGVLFGRAEMSAHVPAFLVLSLLSETLLMEQ